MASDAVGVWWPVCLSEAPTQKEPMGAHCGEEGLVLFRDAGGAVRAVEDRCPHRRAPLSRGRITADGLIQCGYHGWTFDGAGGFCRRIPNLRADERIPDRYRIASYPVREQDGFVYVWMHPANAAPGGEPRRYGMAAGGFSGAQKVTVGHEEFIAALLDDPALVLSIWNIHITQLDVSDLTFEHGEMAIERGAHWGKAARNDRFAPEFPLVLLTRTHEITGQTALSLKDRDGQIVLEAVIACTPDTRGVTSVSWRGRMPAGAGGWRGATARAWCALSGAQPLIVRPWLDGTALSAALPGPSIEWRTRKRKLETFMAA